MVAEPKDPDSLSDLVRAQEAGPNLQGLLNFAVKGFGRAAIALSVSSSNQCL